MYGIGEPARLPLSGGRCPKRWRSLARLQLRRLLRPLRFILIGHEPLVTRRRPVSAHDPRTISDLNTLMEIQLI